MNEDLLKNYQREIECEYKGEHYLVRDNGSVLRRSRPGQKVRKDDDIWTFGKPGTGNYLYLGDARVHIIVAKAFHGSPPTPQHIVDHIDTNRRNNRPENLRWLTRFQNMILNDITRKKLELICGMPIEEILKDISVLREKALPSNMLWMKNVTVEEAKEIKVAWEKWLNTALTRPTSMRKPKWVKLNGKWYMPSPEEDNAVTHIGSSHVDDEHSYPCCPREPSNNPLREYLDNLQPGKICKKTKIKERQFESKLQKAAISPDGDEIIMITDDDGVIYIRYADGIFFHTKDTFYPYCKRTETGNFEYYFPWDNKKEG